MTISPTGPIPPEEFKALVDAPHGHALKIIQKYDPLYGRFPAGGEPRKWRVKLSKEITATGFVTVEAVTAEEAEELAHGVPDHKIDWDYDFDDDGTSWVEEVKPA